MLTDLMIKEFQKIYLEKFGVEITYEEARDKGIKLFLLMRSLHMPLEKHLVEKIFNKSNEKYERTSNE
jgi:hypothetical protein